MVDPIVDVGSGKVTFPKPEEKAKAVAEKKGYVYLPQAVLDKLVGLAKQDGWKPDAETDRGQKQQANKAAAVYVGLAVEMLLTKRAGIAPGQKTS